MPALVKNDNIAQSKLNETNSNASGGCWAGWYTNTIIDAVDDNERRP